MWYRLALLAFVAMLAQPHQGLAQTTDVTVMERATTALDAGVRHWEAGEMERAVVAFREAVAAGPAYVSHQHGATAYWLGRALLDSGEPDEAFLVWSTGLQTLANADILDMNLTDAFVREVYTRKRVQHYNAAAEAYIWLLRALDVDLNDTQRAIAVRHLEPLSWILPPIMLAETGLADLAVAGRQAVNVRLPTGSGERLAAWWRSQDLLPATRANERLQEHLVRVAVAEEKYAKKGMLDDRARVYVRLGEPYKKTRISFDSQEFINKVVFRQLTVSSFDFPQNEFWVYNHIHRSAYYLFIDDLGYYKLGNPNDLLPSSLKGGGSASERAIRKSNALVRTMEEVYGELALLHDDFAIRYQDVADFAELLDQQEVFTQAELERDVMETGGRMETVPQDLSGTNTTMPVRTDLLPQSPHSFAQSLIARAAYEDGVAAKRREEDVPPSYSELFRDEEALPVMVRTARFLDGDGTTRTELFWGVPPGALMPSRDKVKALGRAGYRLPAPYLITATVVEQDASYFDRTRQINRHLVGSLAGSDERTLLEPQSYAVTGSTGRYSITAQWDQYIAIMDALGSTLESIGPLVQRQVYRADSLMALDARDNVLEMSDIRPMTLPTEDGDIVIDLEAATPYPFGRVTSKTPLALYFEVYHLTFGPDDRTHYSIEYEVRRGGGNSILPFLRRGEAESTSAESAYTGSTRKATELLLLDLSEWDGTGPLLITLRVTDETTSQQVERTLNLELVG